MKKFFLIATGIYMVLLGVIALLVGFSGFLTPSELQQSEPESPLYLLLSALPFAAWLASTGIGLCMKKNWARISMLFMSVFGIVIGTTMILVFGLIPFPEPLMDEASAFSFKMFLIGVFGFFLIVLPAIYLFFFTRESVKQTFIQEDAVEGGSRRPVGITALAIFSAAGGFFTLISLLNPTTTEMPLFGLRLEGVMMYAYLILTMALEFYIAYGLWHLHYAAWFVGMAQYGFGFVLMSYYALFTTMSDFLGQAQEVDAGLSLVFKVMMSMSALWGILLLIYLYSRQSAFRTGEVQY